jgi:hypothetical protein
VLSFCSHVAVVRTRLHVHRGKHVHMTDITGATRSYIEFDILVNELSKQGNSSHNDAART